MTRIRICGVSFAAIALLAPQARGQAVPVSVCQMGGAITYMAHLKVTAHQSIDSTVADASALYLVECPGSLVRGFRQLAPYDTETPSRWREVVESAARDSSSSELRGLLAVAGKRVASLQDTALDAYTAGIFQAVDGAPKLGRRGMEAAAERVVLEMLHEHAKCEGDLCGAASDNLVFLLGTHPVAVFKAMRADSTEAREWLKAAADESFAGTEDSRARSEAARRAVIAKLHSTPPGGFDRERRECLETLNRIRYRTFQ